MGLARIWRGFGYRRGLLLALAVSLAALSANAAPLIGLLVFNTFPLAGLTLCVVLVLDLPVPGNLSALKRPVSRGPGCSDPRRRGRLVPGVGFTFKERPIMSSSVLRGALGASLLALLAAPAFAHVSLATKQAQVGSTYKAVFGLGHGCEGAATQVFRVEIPEGFYNVKPMPKAGWDIELITGPYARPYDNHGTVVSEGVREIIWSGGELPDAFFDEFAFRGTFGKDVPAGDFFFPATQECTKGENPWTDTSGSHDVEWPAPKLTLIGAEPSHGHHGDHDAQAATPGTAQAGDLTLVDGFTRATRPGAPVAGGFMRIENAGGTNDRLVGAVSDVAGVTQIHEMRMVDDVMKMRELPEGLEIPAGETVALEPGGYHIMFMELSQPLVEGETVDVTLSFERAGEVTLPLAVLGANAGGVEAAGSHAH